MLQSALDFAQSRKDQQLQELIELVSIPSVSTLPEHQPDIRRAAEWVADHMRHIGLHNVQVLPTAGYPVVYGDWLDAPGQPTVLIYGHYDVQPADPLELWHSDPFQPQVRDGNLYARGADDNKGQFFAHLKAIEAYLATGGRLPVNVKFIVEGEEEIGSKHLADFIATHKDLLKADVALISDSGILGPDQPSIVYGLRGLAYMEIEVVGPDHDLHSGLYGGAIRNPIEVLCQIVGALKDSQGRVTIPGFYDKVRPLDAEERAELARLPFDETRFLRHAGVERSWGEFGYTVAERISSRPSLDPNGIVGGFTGEGSKTVLPGRARAKVSMRLVPDQDPHEIAGLFTRYVTSLCPPEIKISVRLLGFACPAVVDRHIPEMQAAIGAYERGFAARPVFIREGGAIPVVSDLARLLAVPTILMGFGLPDDNLHAPNEKFSLANFYRGIATSIHFLELVKKPGLG
jgi:acetylornithine deacetylase/succinyl-diaminopimelate desuccinylase-like protein